MVSEHRVDLVRHDLADETTRMRWRQPGGKQALKGGADFRRPSATELERDKSLHSPLVAKPVIQSQRVLRWSGAT